MKALHIVLLFSLAPLAFAASDCEHTCCNQYDGSWDDDFDDCKHAKDGFETCVSDCEGAIWANRPQIDTTGGTHYSCKVPFILLSLLGAAFVIGRRLASP